MESQCKDSIKSSDTLSFLPKKLMNTDGYVRYVLHSRIYICELHCICAPYLIALYMCMYDTCMCHIMSMQLQVSRCRFTVEGDLAHRTFHVSLCGHNSHCSQDTSVCYIDNIGETHDVASFTHQTIMTQGMYGTYTGCSRC